MYTDNKIIFTVKWTVHVYAGLNWWIVVLSSLTLCCSLTGNEHLLDSIKAVFTHSISGHFPFNSAADPEARSMDSFCQVTALITWTLVCSPHPSTSPAPLPPSEFTEKLSASVCLIKVFTRAAFLRRPKLLHPVCGARIRWQSANQAQQTGPPASALAYNHESPRS